MILAHIQAANQLHSANLIHRCKPIFIAMYVFDGILGFPDASHAMDNYPVFKVQ